MPTCGLSGAGRPAPWDVVVVGAGPAGVLATERLRAQGLRVLLLEAGVRGRRVAPPTAEDDPRWRFQTLGGRCAWPRIHAVGGRSLLWGGWTSRFPDWVFRDGGWPYGAPALAPHYAAAERWLGVIQGTLDARYRRAAKTLGWPFLPRRGATRGRAIWTARDARAARTACTGTVALALDVEAGRARAVDVIGGRGRRGSVSARAFVLAASPIETCRLLLASGIRHRLLGRRLTDHMLVSYLLVEPQPAPDMAGRGPFPGAALVPRFENATHDPARSYRGGFSIEVVGPWPLPSFAPEILQALRIDARRAASATYVLGLGELSPHPKRFVDLAPRARDALGRPVPRIHLAWSPAERRLAHAMDAACVAVAEAIAPSGSELIRYREPFSLPLLFHPSGTCAMGTTDEYPCDPSGRLRALENVWVADASVFPSAGDRHPTLTALAHALRMVHSIVLAFARVESASRPGGV